jgi:penicillin-binding protein 1A
MLAAHEGVEQRALPGNYVHTTPVQPISLPPADVGGEPVAAAPAKKPQRTVRADKFPPPPVARDVQTGSIKRPSADVGGPKVKRDTSIFDIIMGN